MLLERAKIERIVGLKREWDKREQIRLQGRLDGGLLSFIRHFWGVVEPGQPLIEGWPLDAICEHLEAVTRGEITRLLINIPPGFMKSMCTNVFWPAWEWGPAGKPWLRYVGSSYSQALTLRDNVRFRNIIMSPGYREMWGDKFGPSRDQFNLTKVANDRTGWKLATSVGGIGTGERGNRFVIDDGNSVKEAESEAVRASTNQWFLEVVPTRLNNASTDAIINVQQRTHAEDISGVILDRQLGYVHLSIPMEYDSRVPRIPTATGWLDPRTEDGELAWEDRFPAEAVADLKRTMGPYAVAGQFQQTPAPRGGGIIQRDWWQLWEAPEGKFPLVDMVIVSADTAYTEKEENDPTGCTVWGRFVDQSCTCDLCRSGRLRNHVKLILMGAWRKRLKFRGLEMPREHSETYKAWVKRTRHEWGLVEWLAHSCRAFNADKLLIEAKASGLSVAQEIQRLHRHEGWQVLTSNPDGDKVARAHSVVGLFSGELVYAPETAWADMVIDEVCSFPRGRYRDLTDSTTQALRHFRDSGLLLSKDERRAEEEEATRYRAPPKPLYPA